MTEEECWKDCEYANPKSEIISAYLMKKKENEQLKQQIEKMKCCHSCQSHKLNDLKNCQTCDGNYSNWELAE